MSDRRPEIVGWARVGGLAYLVIGTFWCLGNMLVRYMGPCPASAGANDCTWSAVYRLWLFPVSQAAFLLIGYLLLVIARKRASR